MIDKLKFLRILLMLCSVNSFSFAQDEVNWEIILSSYKTERSKMTENQKQIEDSELIKNLNLPITKSTEMWCDSICKVCNYKSFHFGSNNKYQGEISLTLYQFNNNIIVFGGIFDFSSIPGFFIFYKRENILIFLGNSTGSLDQRDMTFHDIYLIDSNYEAYKRIVLNKGKVIYKTNIKEYPDRKESLFILQKKIQTPFNLKTLLPLFNDQEYWKFTREYLFPELSHNPIWFNPIVTYSEEPYSLNYLTVEEEEE
ncbi:hypothetical protein [Flammeovirga pacifica]|uniref:Uncharacterized protein n=1 Tax=Flammeovirga pacifica TaxID=915059 RepID=A0A1S1YU79_FLAPC|nr:hypothetical protein [Flammeovirga pacifica]OHX64580.1 hypothetical protein NH26_23700 [Flammeovirga pacifica]